MSSYCIPPVYFPTTVFFVDDNADFLSNLVLQLDPELAFRLCDSPQAALEMLNETRNFTTPFGRFFSRYHHTGDLPLTHHVIDLNLDKVHREVYNESRFEQVSVVVVDYDMPGIDGLEFCRRIDNPAIRKILLTGKADEKTAVRAFNEGLIDRFILKQDNDAAAVLGRAIAELQQAYLGETERMLADALTIGKHAFLRDPLFAQEFRRICDKKRIVEYYLCSEPDGMLMLDAQGMTTLLLVPNEDNLRSQHEIAFEQGAPQELLAALKSNQVLPYFWRTGYWTPECRDWRACLYPATEFKGNRWYCYAMVYSPPPFRKEGIVSYQAYLDELDRQGRMVRSV